MTIRDLQPERDAEAVCVLILDAWPISLATAASFVHEIASMPERSHHRGWVAEVGGKAVGWAYAFLNFFGGTSAHLFVGVGSAYRRSGIGSALYDRALQHALSLEPPELVTTFFETTEAVRFAEARGFRETRAEALSVLDPRTVSERPAADVRPLTAESLRDAHRIDETTSGDMPSHEPVTEIPYEEWEEWVIASPTFQQEGSFIAYDDGEPAALSLLSADLDSGRAFNMYTGTLREFRGRGLGKAAKLASINWAAERGITQMFTTNDETNAPMLAINRRLGYEPAGRRVEFSRSADHPREST